MSTINFNNKICFVCDKAEGKTTHHMIPQHIKPLHNITVNVCHKCHDEINKNDIVGMFKYIHRVQLTMKETNGHVKRLAEFLEKHEK